MMTMKMMMMEKKKKQKKKEEEKKKFLNSRYFELRRKKMEGLLTA